MTRLSSKYGSKKTLYESVRNNLSDNDMEVFLLLFSIMYADDTLFFFAESLQDTQLALDSMYEYFSIRGLCFNPIKNKIITLV